MFAVMAPLMEHGGCLATTEHEHMFSLAMENGACTVKCPYCNEYVPERGRLVVMGEWHILYSEMHLCAIAATRAVQ